ncbi:MULTISPECIES: hypothetical protein [unclassified Vibrio]|uniref:hypothetical protein n=1 Tax=unclassified Vibrio TaxID=2614977 RepID=UPI001360DE5E|nr:MULTISPECIES: hypothetical protein [unclassified Vibrio]NAW60299.1 hypothetical protein [Vibrio sp. V36_P2S2PM302]NAX21181.1 hypothetical protein [Vibrio sp. V39_P1S14PM300]NAX24618.1 hypothetical protein [Vibrio sp. V38_P2S17PM301]NAX30479.1 hypothetical protein [Vibrio sp. V37_P2S8PM304]
MKVVIEFLTSGRFRDNFWEGEFYVVRGEHRAVTPSLAAQLIKNRAASFCYMEDDKALFTNKSGQAVFKS